MHQPAGQMFQLMIMLMRQVRCRSKHRLKPLHQKSRQNQKCRLIRSPRAALPNLLNCRKSRLVKSVVVAKRIKNIPMRMQLVVRSRKMRQAMLRQRSINLAQRQPKCKIAAAAKPKKWHRVVQHHAAKLRAVANQVK